MTRMHNNKQRTFKIDLIAPWLLVFISRLLFAGLLFFVGISNLLDFSFGIDKPRVIQGQSLFSVIAACLGIAGGFSLLIGYCTRIVSLVSILVLYIFLMSHQLYLVLYDKEFLLLLVIGLTFASGLLLLAFTGSGPLSIDGNHSSAASYDPALIRTQIWSWFFVLLGVLSIVFLSQVSTHADGADTLDLTHSLREAGLHIGTAFIIFGLFSLFLEFKDFSEYIAKKLSHILIDKGYLEKLDRKQLVVLRQDVDRYALGAPAAKGGGFGQAAEFYNFVNNAFTDVLTSPFRKDYSETYEFFKENGQYIRNRDVQYIFVRGLASKDGGQKLSQMKISWGCSDVVDLKFDEKKLANYLCEMDLRFSYPDKSMSEKTEEVFTLDKNYQREVNEKPQRVIALLKNTRKPEETIEVVFKKRIYGRKKRLEICFEYEIERSEQFDPDDSVVVNIRDRIALLGPLGVVTLQMKYPTQNPTFHFIFRPQQSVVQTATPFHITRTSPLALASPSIAYGETGVTIKFIEWLLPGHGIAVSWTPQGNDDAKNAQ